VLGTEVYQCSLKTRLHSAGRASDPFKNIFPTAAEVGLSRKGKLLNEQAVETLQSALQPSVPGSFWELTPQLICRPQSELLYSEQRQACQAETDIVALLSALQPALKPSRAVQQAPHKPLARPCTLYFEFNSMKERKCECYACKLWIFWVQRVIQAAVKLAFELSRSASCAASYMLAAVRSAGQLLASQGRWAATRSTKIHRPAQRVLVSASHSTPLVARSTNAYGKVIRQ
jgi:hypothetical protein